MLFMQVFNIHDSFGTSTCFQVALVRYCYMYPQRESRTARNAKCVWLGYVEQHKQKQGTRTLSTFLFQLHHFQKLWLKQAMNHSRLFWYLTILKCCLFGRVKSFFFYFCQFYNRSVRNISGTSVSQELCPTWQHSSLFFSLLLS